MPLVDVTGKMPSANASASDATNGKHARKGALPARNQIRDRTGTSEIRLPAVREIGLGHLAPVTEFTRKLITAQLG
jgi:hypothetical protein